MFKLLRYFSLTSALALVLVTIALVSIHYRSAIDELVNMAESQNAALARSFANTIWPRFSGYVTTVEGDGDQLRSRPETAEIHSALRALTNGLPVLKVKIYKLDGSTVFSSEPSQIGQNKRNNPGFFQAAMQGRFASKLSFRDSFSAFEGTVQKRDLVESYLPIVGSGGATEAVFELYTDVTPLKERIARTTNRLVFSAVAAFALLYAVLFLIVVRADRTIKGQYRALLDSEERIKGQNDELTRQIDEHRRTEETLRKLTRAVEQSPAMTLVTDTDGAIEYVNPRFTEVTGYDLEEVFGRNPRFLQSGDTPVQVYTDLWARISAGEEWRGELKNRRKDGTTYWVASSISPIKDADGRITHFVGISEDITERRRAQKALVSAKQEAENANLSKSKFFAAASHDLRQPLHTMSLYLPLLAKRVTDPEGTEIVDAIRASCDSMGRLLSALLDISKLDAGVVTPRMAPVGTLPLLRKLEREFAVEAATKGIQLRVVPAERILLTDATLLERVLRNLLANAVCHTDSGRILLGCRRRGDRLRIEVWDTGRGIEAPEMDRIFQEFYQVGNPERDRNQGLGLGLAIVQRLARLLGHRLSVDSVPGRGSVFSIEVPVVDSYTTAPAVDSADHPPAGRHDLTGKLVVLVDDDIQVLAVTTRILRDWGCEVIGAETIGAALAKIGAQARVPDLILADFRLRAEETGLMAVQLISRLLGTEVPAIIVTGDTDPQRIREATASGHPLLHKPVQPDALRAAIESRLGQPAPEPDRC